MENCVVCYEKGLFTNCGHCICLNCFNSLIIKKCCICRNKTNNLHLIKPKKRKTINNKSNIRIECEPKNKKVFLHNK